MHYSVQIQQRRNYISTIGERLPSELDLDFYLERLNCISCYMIELYQI